MKLDMNIPLEATPSQCFKLQADQYPGLPRSNVTSSHRRTHERWPGLGNTQMGIVHRDGPRPTAQAYGLWKAMHLCVRPFLVQSDNLVPRKPGSSHLNAQS